MTSHEKSTRPYRLRSLLPGDIGHIVSRHGSIYANEYGWDITFESTVARLGADMIDFFDPSLECCWVAESVADSSFLGCVAVLKDRRDQTAAQLRLLLVEEGARGMGLGSQLIKECVDFARAKGYQKVVLFTMSILVGARRLYERAGFNLVQSDPEKEIWGNKLINEVWELRLS